MAKTNDKMRAELLDLFTRFDGDDNGCIDKVEFREIVKALGQEKSDHALAEQFAIVDKDGDGSVQFEEFVTWWLEHE